MVRIKDEISPKISETKKLEGCRKRGRPQLRREECVEKDRGGRKVEKRPKTGRSEKITKVAVQQSDNRPASPPQKRNERANKGEF